MIKSNKDAETPSVYFAKSPNDVLCFACSKSAVVIGKCNKNETSAGAMNVAVEKLAEYLAQSGY